jgi:hypothetical protein
VKIPEELKIEKTNWPDPYDFANELLKHLIGQPQGERGSGAIEVAVSRAFVTAFLAAATNAWRIRSRLVDTISTELRESVGKDDLKKISRSAEAILEALRVIGMEVKDRTGEAFDYGMPEKVIATQPQEGLNSERVVETIRPTVYWQGQIVQHGEIVIATPKTASTGRE